MRVRRGPFRGFRLSRPVFWAWGAPPNLSLTGALSASDLGGDRRGRREAFGAGSAGVGRLGIGDRFKTCPP